uniref:HSP22-like protein interacting protein 27 n=1 Tax=Homo sapiens TaxID=9606 RepID=Q9H2B0_HUMAN|nr:HSP22-like protein interacting protein 27 [Homo sapiens]
MRLKVEIRLFLTKDAIKFQTVEPHLQYLRLITVNFGVELFFDSEGGLLDCH